MAEFCNICTSAYAESTNSKELFDILYHPHIHYEDQINVNHMFTEYILPNLDKFTNDPTTYINVYGVCEGCGLVGLSVVKKVIEGSHPETFERFLKAWVYNPKPIQNEILVAKIMDDNKLEYDLPVIVEKLYPEK